MTWVWPRDKLINFFLFKAGLKSKTNGWIYMKFCVGRIWNILHVWGYMMWQLYLAVDTFSCIILSVALNTHFSPWSSPTTTPEISELLRRCQAGDDDIHSTECFLTSSNNVKVNDLDIRLLTWPLPFVYYWPAISNNIIKTHSTTSILK